MSTLEAIILGIVQGITEFFPVSSSGHLKLFQMLFGWENLDQYILFDITCHLGTLLAICLLLRKEIYTVLVDDRKQMLTLIIGLIPLLPLYFLLKQIHALYDTPKLLGFFFLLTSGLLYTGERFSRKQEPNNNNLSGFIIGCFQALAILPGVSRSGATISSAKWLGWSYDKAFRFSFLLAIPTILGGTLVELRSMLKSPNLPPVGGWQYFLGFFFSFLVGFFALKVLRKLLNKHGVSIFIWYCFFLGIATCIYTLFVLR